MKKIKIVLFAFLTIFCLNNAQAQSHISTGKWACQLVPSSLGYEKYTCPACEVQNKKDQEAKIAEEKRRFAEAQAAAKAKKEASEKERLEKIEEDKKNSESGKVYINGNNSNGTTNTSTEQIPDDYKGNPLHYNNPNVSSGSSAVDDINKGYQQGQQISNIATGLADLFTPSPEQIQRREQAAAEYVRQKKLKEDLAWKKRIIDDGNRFDLLYLPLMNKANNGDENARMILCFASHNLLSTQKVPKRQQWLNEAYSNNNTDAILGSAPDIPYNEATPNAIPYFEKAASLGSTDALLILAVWYSYKKELPYGGIGGENANLALGYFTKAAELGSPNASYYLGMIYKYGIIGDGTGVGFQKKLYVTFNIIMDEKKAYEYFLKSMQPDYMVSNFYRGCYNPGLACEGSYFNKGTYKELALIYKKGKVVPQDKLKANEYQTKFETYKLDKSF